MRVKNSEGNVLMETGTLHSRWSKYFECLLNVDGGRRAQLTEEDLQREIEDLIGELRISLEEVRKAVKKLKKGKSPGVDGITSEMLIYGGEGLLRLLTRVCNVCVAEEKVPADWVRAIIVPI